MSSLDGGKVVPFDGVMQEPCWPGDSGFISLESALRRKPRRGQRVTKTSQNAPTLPPSSDHVYRSKD